MAKKILYSFTLDKEDLVDEVEITKDESGNEIKTTKKVKKSVPNTFHLLRPTRSMVEEAELFYGIKLAEGIEKGLLPKKLLMKRYEEAGGYLPKQDQDKRDDLYKKFVELQEKLIRSAEKAIEDKTPEEKESDEAVNKEFMAVYDQLREIEKEYNDLFEHTAEVWAKNKTIIWWTLFLSAKDKNGEPIPLFDGATYEAKLKSNDKLEEEEDSFIVSVIRRFMFLTGFWYSGKAVTKEDFDAVLQLFKTDV